KNAGVAGNLDTLRAQGYLALLTGVPVTSLLPADHGGTANSAENGPSDGGRSGSRPADGSPRSGRAHSGPADSDPGDPVPAGLQPGRAAIASRRLPAASF